LIERRPNQILSAPFTAFFLRLPVTPNQITVLSLFAGLSAGILFSFGTKFFSIAGAFFYVLACLLDECDGAISRAKNLSSKLGGQLDIFGDFLTDFCLFAGIAAGMLRSGYPILWIVLPLVVCLTGLTLHLWITLLEKSRGFGPASPRTVQAGLPKRSWFKQIFDALRSGDACWLVLCIALIGKIEFVLWLGMIYMPVLTLSASLLAYRKLQS